MYRFSFTQYSHAKHMVESTELSLLLTSHIITGTEEMMSLWKQALTRKDSENLGERTACV